MATLYFRCACKKTMAVDEKGAGMAVTCPDCGQPLTVPAVAFQSECPHCGEAMALPENMAGQDVQCANCCNQLSIPAAESAPATKAAPAAAQATSTAMLKISSLGILSSEVAPGAVLGGFQAIKLLGKGAMGEVWLAKQLSMGREVALKILPPQFARNRDYVNRFMREVRLAAKLEHAHIVTAYEAGEAHGVLFLAMAYMKGETLEDRLKREGPLAEPEALRLTRQLAEGLAYAWDVHRLLHRDVKPANIMLDAQGNAKLMDMGISKSLADRAEVTLTGMIIGTPNYMSPEQIEGKCELDFRADIYSLGMTLYHMLTGKVPFGGSSVMETLRKQVMEALPSVQDINVRVSPGCVILLEIMLAKDRECRHAGWRELLADVDRVLAGNPPVTAMVKAGESVMLRAGEMKAAPHRPSGAGMRAASGKPAGNRNKLMLGAAAGVVVVAVIAVGIMLAMRKPGAQPVAVVPPATNASETGRVGPPGRPFGSVVPQASAPGADSQSGVRQAYLSALEYAATNASDYAGVLDRFESLRAASAGTEFDVKIAEQIQRLSETKQQAVTKTWQALKAGAEELAAKEQYAAALAKLEQYTGAFAAETAADRATLAQVFKEKQAAQDKEKTATAARQAETDTKAAEAKRLEQAQTNAAAVLNTAAEALLKGEARQAFQVLLEAQKQTAPAAAAEDMKTAANLAEQAAGLSEAILAGYEREKGKEVVVEFKGGRRETLQIAGTSGGQVTARRQLKAGYLGRDFGLAEISAEEKIKRLGEAATPAASLLRGLVWWSAGNAAAAEAQFKAVGGDLGAALVRIAGAAQAAGRELLARQALSNLLAANGLKTDLGEPAPMVAAITKQAWSKQRAEQVARAAKDYQAKFGESQIAGTYRPVLEALGNASAEPAPAQPVAAAPPSAATKTAEPPGPVATGSVHALGGPMLQVMEDNVNRAVDKFFNDNKLDRTEWNISQKVESGEISLEIKAVKKYGNTICQIQALAGLPLSMLSLTGLQVESLDPLRGMRLKSLVITEAGLIRDLSPLTEMPLETLQIEGCKALKRFEPLQKLYSLRVLELSGASSFKDLSVLSGLKNIKCLSLSSTGIKDIAALKDASFGNLESLEIGNTKVNDLEPLRGKRLSKLICYDTLVTNLSVLTDMPLTQVGIGHPSYALDISPLAGKKLGSLRITGKVKTFAPLNDVLWYSDKNTRGLDLPENWESMPDAEKLPEYLPNLARIYIPTPTKKAAEIVLRFPNLRSLYVAGEKVMTLDEFKKQFGPKEKEKAEKGKGQ